MSVVERVEVYANAASRMQQTHKGTPHAANGEPLHIDDLRALLVLARACEAREEVLTRGHDESVEDRVRYAKEEHRVDRAYSDALKAVLS